MPDITVTTLPSEQNPLLTFLTRVKEDRAKGLSPAGQVYPPPTEKKEEGNPANFEFPTGYS